MIATADATLFARAIETVLAHEGGYVNDPNDPGGETNFGISKRSYPDLDIASLTRDAAVAIYRRDWWDRHGYARLAVPNLAAKILDLAVNVGHRKAIVLLQRALRAAGRTLAEDGELGPETLGAVQRVDAAIVLAAMRAEAAGHYRVLIAKKPELVRFRAGWLARAYS